MDDPFGASLQKRRTKSKKKRKRGNEKEKKRKRETELDLDAKRLKSTDFNKRSGDALVKPELKRQKHTLEEDFEVYFGESIEQEVEDVIHAARQDFTKLPEIIEQGLDDLVSEIIHKPEEVLDIDKTAANIYKGIKQRFGIP